MKQYPENLRVCLDSRLIKKGEYFVPIKGENYDGHDFVQQALENGAAGMIEEEELYALARKKLKTIQPLIIGVTGSSGKSTVVHFLSWILSSKYEVCRGTLNTKVGLCVNVINNMSEETNIFVAEMGMDRKGELADTTSLFRPDIAIITTINHVHVEKLGSFENLVAAKGEILQNLKRDGVAFLNSENKFVRSLANKTDRPVIWFDSEPLYHYPKKLAGSHNVLNLNACIKVAQHLKLRKHNIYHRINGLQLLDGRMHQLTGINDSTIIDDTYNSNPESAKFALDVLSSKHAKRRIAILGDMLELGKFSVGDHKEVGKYVATLGNINILITVGEKSKDTHKSSESPGLKRIHVKNTQELIDSLSKGRFFKLKKGDVVLIKGSQAMRLEKIIKPMMKIPKTAKKYLVRQDARWV